MITYPKSTAEQEDMLCKLDTVETIQVTIRRLESGKETGDILLNGHENGKPYKAHVNRWLRPSAAAGQHSGRSIYSGFHKYLYKGFPAWMGGKSFSDLELCLCNHDEVHMTSEGEESFLTAGLRVRKREDGTFQVMYSHGYRDGEFRQEGEADPTVFLEPCYDLEDCLIQIETIMRNLFADLYHMNREMLSSYYVRNERDPGESEDMERKRTIGGGIPITTEGIRFQELQARLYQGQNGTYSYRLAVKGRYHSKPYAKHITYPEQTLFTDCYQAFRDFCVPQWLKDPRCRLKIYFEGVKETYGRMKNVNCSWEAELWKGKDGRYRGKWTDPDPYDSTAAFTRTPTVVCEDLERFLQTVNQAVAERIEDLYGRDGIVPSFFTESEFPTSV